MRAESAALGVSVVVLRPWSLVVLALSKKRLEKSQAPAGSTRLGLQLDQILPWKSSIIGSVLRSQSLM